jgi:hypothetical protein
MSDPKDRNPRSPLEQQKKDEDDEWLTSALVSGLTGGNVLPNPFGQRSVIKRHRSARVLPAKWPIGHRVRGRHDSGIIGLADEQICRDGNS